MPTFDVIIPAYNAEQYLSRTIDSVVAQTLTDWRILLVDDGSGDSTPSIAAHYQAQLGNRLQYIRQENAGLAAARNTAIRHATAEFLALLDADDLWLPNRLQKTFERFQQVPQAGLTYGFVARVDPEDNILDVFETRNRHAEGHVAPYLYMRTLDLCCPTVTFRRACVQEVGGFDETLRSSEDRDLWIRIASRYHVALVPERIALYRVSPNSMSTDLNRMARSQQQLIAKHYGLPGCGWKARRVALSWLFRQRAEGLVERGQFSAAAKDVLRAIWAYPLQRHAFRTLASVMLRYTRRRRSCHPAPYVRQT